MDLVDKHVTTHGMSMHVSYLSVACPYHSYVYLWYVSDLLLIAFLRRGIYDWKFADHGAEKVQAKRFIKDFVMINNAVHV